MLNSNNPGSSKKYDSFLFHIKATLPLGIFKIVIVPCVHQTALTPLCQGFLGVIIVVAEGAAVEEEEVAVVVTGYSEAFFFTAELECYILCK